MSVDFYDYKAVKELLIKRKKKYLVLVKKWHEAKESGCNETMKKAFLALKKHQDVNVKFQERAEETGACWY